MAFLGLLTFFSEENSNLEAFPMHKPLGLFEDSVYWEACEPISIVSVLSLFQKHSSLILKILTPYIFKTSFKQLKKTYGKNTCDFHC